jgi:heptaprenyl diphosphate synthase
MIFQLTDDCIDYEETEVTAKKPVQSDFEQGVITLPLIYAFRKVEGFRQKAKDNAISRSELTDTVRKANGISYTREISGNYYNKSRLILDKLNMPDDKRTLLKEILDEAFYGTKKKQGSV